MVSGKSALGKSTEGTSDVQVIEFTVLLKPTDAPIGQMIRSIFNHKMEADHRTIAGLFVTDRLDHLLNKTNRILQKWRKVSQ